MTEAEAKTKWCPFARVAGGSAERGNRWMDTETGVIVDSDALSAASRCIASACMAWRALPDERWKDGDLKPLTADDPGGYCGLAGRP